MLDEIDKRVRWQIDCDETIKDKNNVILSSPTGSGKTDRYERWALNKKERPIFITAPIKSLSNQRFRELQRDGYKVGLETGDIKYFPEGGCDIICCTQEIYNHKYREVENATLIIDEFSYIFDRNTRARAYIDSLYYSKATNIMLLSATFNNPEMIKEYLNRLTGRDFYLYENNDRLTPLEYIGEIEMEKIRDSLVVTYSKKCCELIADALYEDRLRRIREFLGVNAHSYDPRKRYKNEILTLAKKYDIDNEHLIDLATIGVVYYYGTLLPKEKIFIEELFENRLIDTIVGTDALALGVNFPVQNVVFSQFQKIEEDKFITIGKDLFEQLSGIAGRKGYFDKGYVYYCDNFKLDCTQNEIRELHLNDPNSKKIFYSLLNETVSEPIISLEPNIRNILMDYTTISEETAFIVNYSTEEKDYYEEQEKIKKMVDYIKNFDVALSYIKKGFHKIDFEKGYSNSLDEASKRTIKKIESLSTKLMFLQPYFDKDIKVAYMHEYSKEQNCFMFVDILLEVPIEKLIGKYCHKFNDLLLLRKYMKGLPQKYTENYDLNYLDEVINNRDYTVLHPERYKLDKKTVIIKEDKNKEKIEQKKKPKQKISKKKKKQLKEEEKRREKLLEVNDDYFKLIMIKGREYIRLFDINNQMIVCENTDSESLKLYRYPKTTKYKFIKFISKSKSADILSRIDETSLEKQREQVKTKFKMLKLSNK